MQVIFTAVALSITDRRGRRFFLILGCLMMAVSIAIVGISTLISPPPIDPPCHKVVNATFPELHAHSILNPTTLKPTASIRAIHNVQLAVDVVSLMIYIIGYSLSFGPSKLVY